jgi:hypothetical protein
LAAKNADQLLFNRIATYIQEQGWVDSGMVDATVLNRIGLKRAHGQMNDPDGYSINWQTDELIIHDSFNQLINNLAASQIRMEYNLIFWDKEHYRQTGSVSIPRFQNEDDIQRYLDFVRIMVRAFGDQVDYWELWNEPSWHPACIELKNPQCIPLETYLSVAYRVIPIIREEDPGAKIVLPSYHGWDPPGLYQNYFYKILESDDLMPLVDVIAWHPFLVNLDPPECGGDWFDLYETTLPEIKSRATAHGFRGEFSADDLNFRIRTPSTTAPCAVPDRTSGKYLAREIIHHLGEDVSTGAILNGDTQNWMVVQNLATLMAGAQPASFPVETSPASGVLIYTFTLPDDSILATVWNDIDITDEDVTINATLRMPGLAPYTPYGIDALAGIQQRLVASQVGEDLIIENLLLRAHPLLVRLEAPRLYLPLVWR